MIMFYDIVLATIILAIAAGLIWYIANAIRFMALKSGGGKGGFFSLSDKWLDNERGKKGEQNAKSKKTGAKSKGGK
jgi:hypothetical protein